MKIMKIMNKIKIMNKMKIMKRYIALLSVMLLTFATFLTGCAKGDSQNLANQPGTAENQMGINLYDGVNGFRDDHDPLVPDERMSPESIETLPVEENEDLFTDRDLNQKPDITGAQTITAKNNSDYTICSSGVYILSGEAVNFTIKVEADNDDEVQILLNGVTVTNDSSPVIYVKSADKCYITLQDSNRLVVNNQFTADGENNTDAVIFSKDNLTLNGTGSLTIISAAGNGITSKDDMKITGGKYDITCAMDAIEANDSISVYDGEFVISTDKDGFHCENDEQLGSIYIKSGTFTINAKDDGMQATSTLVIGGGNLDITAAEGLEATYVQINGGDININASDDGINATGKSREYDVIIEINGGRIVVVMGPGDTDGLDANGTIIVNGGTIDVTGNSTFDADYGSVYNGGTIIINGVTVDSIPTSMMGGHGGGGGNKWERSPSGN